MWISQWLGCSWRPPMPLDGHTQNWPLWQCCTGNHRPEGKMTQDRRSKDSLKVPWLSGTPHNTTWPSRKNPGNLTTPDGSAGLNQQNQRTTWQNRHSMHTRHAQGRKTMPKTAHLTIWVDALHHSIDPVHQILAILFGKEQKINPTMLGFYIDATITQLGKFVTWCNTGAPQKIRNNSANNWVT